MRISEEGVGSNDRTVLPLTIYQIQRHIQYSFTIKNTADHLLSKAEFWTYAPVKWTSTQRSEILEASHPFQILIDPIGNQILHFTWHNMPPHATKVVSIRGVVSLSDISYPLQDSHLDIFLRPEAYVESDNPHVMRVARQLVQGADYATAANIFQWIVQHLSTVGYTREDRGALEALSQKQGDCTELMYVFVAFCRVNGIPARGVGGYVLHESATLKASDYHNWAEVYVDGAWRIVDPQRRVFMEQQSDYIAMRIISGVLQNPLGDMHRFVVSGDGLQATMD